jgi:hypothetical protein
MLNAQMVGKTFTKSGTLVKLLDSYGLLICFNDIEDITIKKNYVVYIGEQPSVLYSDKFPIFLLHDRKMYAISTDKY